MEPFDLDSLEGVTGINLADALLQLDQLAASQGFDTQAYQNTLATAAAQLDLSTEDLFAAANTRYRQLANSFGVAGLGDSGFAQRERNEFGDQRERDETQLLINYQDTVNRAALALNRQRSSDAFASEDLLNDFQVQNPRALYEALLQRGFSPAEASQYSGYDPNAGTVAGPNIGNIS